MPITNAEMDAIAAKAAQKVWAMKLKNPTGTEEVPAADLLWYTNQQATDGNFHTLIQNPMGPEQVPAGDLMWYSHIEGTVTMNAVTDQPPVVPPAG